jgi:nitrite reductase/ring-hydroxylating ferredoxin subunit
VKPYFLASNSAYTILWLSYFLFLYGSRRRSKVSLDRRGFIRASTVAAIAVAGAVLGRFIPNSTTGAATPPKNIIKGAALKVGQTHNFVSKAGTPAVLFRSKNGIFAYSAVCTHAGCTVQYNTASRNLQCGCHGAVFDPENGAKVLAGPTTTPLAKIKVAAEGAWIVES